jgi:hypothetical protein
MLGVGTQFFKLFSLPNLEDKKYEQESDNLSWAFQCICMTGGVDWACKKKKKKKQK